mmetsp:Transcript_17601/g.33102  ORF Transcript_17601/g.33102 Transcript_17601/m.33102 type:complete len:203 (+) Transcript_17601:368-976(+)
MGMGVAPGPAPEVRGGQGAAVPAHCPEVVGPCDWPRSAVCDHWGHAVGLVVLEVPGPHLVQVVALRELDDSCVEHRVAFLQGDIHAREHLEVSHAVIMLHEAGKDPISTEWACHHSHAQGAAEVCVPGRLGDAEPSVNGSPHACEPCEEEAHQDQVHSIREQVLHPEGRQPAGRYESTPRQQLHQHQGCTAHADPLPRQERS